MKLLTRVNIIIQNKCDISDANRKRNLIITLNALRKNEKLSVASRISGIILVISFVPEALSDFLSHETITMGE